MTLSPFLLALHLGVAPISDASALRCEVAQPAVPLVARADSTLEALYASGQTWQAFFDAARARRALWVRNWEQGTVPADVLESARALPGSWRLLIVAIDACSDSVNTIPYLARLSALVPTIDIRIVPPDARGVRMLQGTRRTPDGRMATPTVVLLDAAGNDAGCWVERPAALHRLAAESRAAGQMDRWPDAKQEWYTADAGASTVREVVALLTEAAAGRPRCDSGSPSQGL